jgi:hypothetical protein
MALPDAFVEHKLPGRTRLRVASRIGDAAFFARVQTAMADLPGFRSVRTHVYCGGIILQYAGGIDILRAFARDRQLFEIVPEPERGQPSGRVSPAYMPSRGQALSFAAAGMAGLGVYQATRGRLVGNAVENLWNAYGATAQLRMPWVSAVLAGFGLYRLASGPVLGSATSLVFYALNARAMAKWNRGGT